MAEFLVCLKQHTKDRKLMDAEGYDENGKYCDPHPCFLGGRQPHCELLIPAPLPHHLPL